MKLPGTPDTSIWQDLASFQQFAEEVHARMTDPDRKKALGTMLNQLRDARAETVVPAVALEMKAGAEAQQAELAKLQAELEAFQADLAAKKQEAERLARQPARHTTVPMESAPDRNRGRQLTHELLNRFAPAP